jgi:mercuric reductase
MTDRTAHRAVLEVRGMTCDSCARRVGAALEEAGARNVAVKWQEGEARFLWPASLGEDQIRRAVVAAGRSPDGPEHAYTPGTITILPDSEAGIPSTLPAFDPSRDYDLVAIGAGSASFAAAIRAVEAGYRVALVEAGTLGGTCVNVGCVPSKALLRPGELAWLAGHHPFNGLAIEPGRTDIRTLVAEKDDLVSALRQAKYADLVHEYGFDVLPGRASFLGPDSIVVEGREITARVFLVATGASPAAPPVPGLADAGYLTSTTALEVTEVPSSLVVIGANAIGLELGQFFMHLGSKVTFVDIADRIAPFEEPEVSEALAEVLRSRGATIHTGAQVTSVKRTSGHVDVTLGANDRSFSLVAEQLLVATGRRPNTDGLALDRAGVEIDARGAVVVDNYLKTANPRIYAAGDVTGGPQFVYVSAYEGALAVGNALLGEARPVDFTGLPRVTFTAPQVASAGVTEAQAVSQGIEVRTSLLPLDAVPRALVNRDTHGLVKLVAEAASGKLLGASIMAEGAGDVIQAAVLAIRHGISVEEIAATFHPYLTMAEGLKLAAQTFDRDVAKLSCCAA